MNNRDRQAVAKLLNEVVGRLRAAPADTDEMATRYQRSAGSDLSGRFAHQAGQLEQTCRNEANAIQVTIEQYLTPKTTTRGPRKRR